MREREREILKVIGGRDGWVTSSEVSSALGISVRTVKSYIGDIFESCPGLLESSREGFRIVDRELFARSIIQSIKPEIPQDAKGRRKFMLCRLLLEENECGFDKLAEELCISPVTLTNELPKIKSYLEEFELNIRTKGGRIFIDGPEINKKKLISRLIYDDTKDSFMDLGRVQSYLPNFNLTRIKSIITGVLKSHRYFMDDFSLLNLVLHIAISLERKQMAAPQAEPESMGWETLVNAHIRKIVEDIIGRIEEEFDVEFAPGEVHGFALLITTRVISDAINDVNTERLSEFVGEDVIKLVSLMQSRTKETYSITITNEDFTVRFSLHLKNLLVRLENGVKLRNPQMTDIKNSYPFIYDVSVFLANILTQQTGYVLSEDEISYFALHLGVLIEERKAIKHEVRAMVLCPQYYGTSLEFANKLKAVFKDNLLVTGIIGNPDELRNYDDYDLVVSTVPIDGFTDKSCATVSSFLSNRDVLALSATIEDILKKRIKTKVESKLRAIFKKELFFADGSINNQGDAINIMGGALVTQGYADRSFIKKLFEREQISSSAYLNIAIPHPLEMCALKTAIAVSVHQTPLAWNDRQVNIVFMLAINIRDRLFFKDIFDFITDVISEEKKLKTLLKTRTYEEFIAALVSFAK